MACIVFAVCTAEILAVIAACLQFVLMCLCNLQFNCTEKCPDFAPYKEASKKGNETEIVCVSQPSYYK